MQKLENVENGLFFKSLYAFGLYGLIVIEIPGAQQLGIITVAIAVSQLGTPDLT